MNANITLTEGDIKILVLREIRERLNMPELSEKDVKFEVKASMNYKSEWETGKFRATVNKDV